VLKRTYYDLPVENEALSDDHAEEDLDEPYQVVGDSFPPLRSRFVGGHKRISAWDKPIRRHVSQRPDPGERPHLR
jgi:hypothetical protein